MMIHVILAAPAGRPLASLGTDPVGAGAGGDGPAPAGGGSWAALRPW